MNVNEALQIILHSTRLPAYAELIDRRVAEERERRDTFYREMTDERKMEFIAGHVIAHSPARYCHLRASSNLSSALYVWLGLGEGRGIASTEKALCCFTRNDYEPDIVYFGPEKCLQIRPDTLKFPVPDFVVEILSESTEVRDRGVKFEDFAAHGVREYWIVDPQAELLEQYVLSSGESYSLQLKSGSGDVRSVVVDGFQIPIRAIFDAQENMRTITAMITGT